VAATVLAAKEETATEEFANAKFISLPHDCSDRCELSPDWMEFLNSAGIEDIVAPAVTSGYTIVTQDLDFGTILSATRANSEPG
jgi:predicted nuclease of predicted toxin-antitoxin system